MSIDDVIKKIEELQERWNESIKIWHGGDGIRKIIVADILRFLSPDLLAILCQAKVDRETVEKFPPIESRWKCDYCGTFYAEYVNGCPRCHFGEPGTSTSVRKVDAIRLSGAWHELPILAALAPKPSADATTEAEDGKV